MQIEELEFNFNPRSKLFLAEGAHPVFGDVTYIIGESNDKGWCGGMYYTDGGIIRWVSGFKTPEGVVYELKETKYREEQK